MQFPKSTLLALAASATFLLSTPLSQGQTVLYNATATGTGSTQPVFHYLQQVTLNGANTQYSISSMVFGINWTDLSADQSLYLDFWTGLNLSPTAASALNGATFIKEVGFSLTAPTAAGNYTYTLTFGTPVLVPSNTFGIEAYLLDATGTNYSTGGVNGRFTLGAGVPSVGSSPGFVWADTNLDGTFTGAEQTKFGNANAANIRMTITAQPVPEPATWSLLVGGALVAGLVSRRRLAA